MPYQKRIEYPGATYHVTARGNNHQEIFFDEFDRLQFLEILNRLIAKHGIQITALTLMDNHYHLVLTTIKGGLARFMFDLNRLYVLYFNRRYRRSGRLFGSRYYANIIENDWYLETAILYVLRNAEKAGKVDSGEQYSWCWSLLRKTGFREWLRELRGST